MKFGPASSCKASACHGAANGATPPAQSKNQFTVWNSDDKHHTSFKTLSSDRSAKIAAACGIADATKSPQCLGCHALDVPAALQGEGFKLAEGVSCDACHGPSVKWLTPHAKKNWLDEQRKAFPDHAALLQAQGIYDTKPVLARADRCASCHLAIDARLIKANHPQPLFELAYFSDSLPKHWTDPDGVFITRVWAVGQAVCLRDAALQVADRLNGGADHAQLDLAIAQTRSHIEMLQRAVDVAAPTMSTPLQTAAANFQSSPATAQALSGIAQQLAELMDKTTFTAPQTLAVLKAISTADLKPLGRVGQLQQAEGMSELFTAYATATALSDDAAVDAFAKLPPPSDSPGGELDKAYDANLKAAQAHLPK
jgi:hypothetical protein